MNNCSNLCFREPNSSYKIKMHILDGFMYGWTDHKSLLQDALEVLLQADFIKSVQQLKKQNIAVHRFSDFSDLMISELPLHGHREAKAAKAVPSTGEWAQRWEAEQEQVE